MTICTSPLPDILPARSGLRMLVLPCSGLALALLGGVLYAALDVFIVQAGVGALLLLLSFSLSLAGTLRWMAGRMQCEQPRFRPLCGFFCGLFGWYVAWIAFEYLLRWQQGRPLGVTVSVAFVSPGLACEVAAAIAREGWYSIGTWTPTGKWLWCAWAIEALIMIVPAAGLATGKDLELVSSAASDEWCRTWSPRCSPSRNMGKSARSMVRSTG